MILRVQVVESTTEVKDAIDEDFLFARDKLKYEIPERDKVRVNSLRVGEGKATLGGKATEFVFALRH